MTRADFTTWGRNIFPEPNRSPTMFIPSMSGPSITWIGRSYFVRASSVSSTIQSTMPFTRGVREALLDRSLAPFQLVSLGLRRRLHSRGELDQALARVGAPVEHDVLDALAKIGRDLLVDAELAGVHDPHGHAGADRVIQEYGVDRLAHRVVAAEG